MHILQRNSYLNRHFEFAFCAGRHGCSTSTCWWAEYLPGAIQRLFRPAAGHSHSIRSSSYISGLHWQHLAKPLQICCAASASAKRITKFRQTPSCVI